MRKNMKLMIGICILSILVVGSFGTLAYLTDTAGVTNTFTVGKVDITLDEAVVDKDGNPLDENKNITSIDKADRVEGNAEGTSGNTYHLIPGKKYVKDPTITVEAGSEASYIRAIMIVHNADAVDAIIAEPKHKLDDYADLFDGWNETKWKYIGYTADDEANTIAFEFRYFEPVAGFEKDADGKYTSVEKEYKLEPLFTHLVAPATLTGEEIAALYGDVNDPQGDFKMVIEGHAIQVVGFEDAKNADGSLKKSAEDVAWEAFSGQETGAAKGATVR